MKVLHLSLAGFSNTKKGGGERYVSELVAGQKELGVEACLMVWPRLSDRISLMGNDGSGHAVSLPAAMRAIRSSDVVHVHQLNSPGFDLAALGRCLGGPRIVLTDHGGGALTPGRIFGNARLRAVAGAAFVSQWSQQDVDPEGRIPTREVVFGGGDHLPAPSERHFSADYAFVGRLLPHKGPHVVIEALPSNKKLVVAGQARDSDYFAELERLARGKQVEFVTDLRDEDLEPLYRSVGALVVPSVNRYKNQSFSRPELLGLVALEALACGTPVIGSDVGGLGELLSREGQTVLPNGDVRAWNGLLERFRPEDHRVDGALYSWRRVAEVCLHLYRRVLQTA